MVSSLFIHKYNPPLKPTAASDCFFKFVGFWRNRFAITKFVPHSSGLVQSVSSLNSHNFGNKDFE
jgi:hypothetical protein